MEPSCEVSGVSIAGMRFAQMVSAHGFGVAVVTNADSLSEEFWRQLHFDRWHEIYLAIGKKTAGLRALETRAVTSMTGLAGRFEQWLIVYDIVCPMPEEWADGLTTLAWANLEKLARTFDQWLDIYYRARDATRIEGQALRKLSTLRAGVDRLCDLHAHTPPKTKLMRVIRRRLGNRFAYQ
ncbi:MAG: hypothetical protein ACYDH9_20190 [Limisphaerales bacterium]